MFSVRANTRAFVVLLCLLTSPTFAANFPVCSGGHRVTCVVDGDTFWLEGVKIRPEGFDAPEMGGPKCDRRAAGAIEARDALRAILQSGEVSYRSVGRSYDRVLAQVSVGGRDLTKLMLATGLVRRYQPGAAPWC